MAGLKSRMAWLIAVIWLALSGSPAIASDDAVLVWGKPDGQTIDLFFAKKTDDQWSTPEQITDSSFPDLQPSVIADKSGNAWVVWVEMRNLHELHGQLFYRYQQDGVWLPPAEIQSELSTNLAPSIVIDGSDTPWIVWAGVDGKDDEIFYSQWDGSGWSKPERVNEDNDVPDILPELELDLKGRPVVSWMGFNGDIYVRRYRAWSGSEWKDVPEKQEIELSMRDFQPVKLPDYMDDRFQASIYVLGSRRSVKLQSRLVQ